MSFYILQQRKDRTGSNFMIQVGDFIFCRINNYKLLYNKNEYKYIDSVFFYPIVSMSIENIDNMESNIHVYPGIRGSSAISVELLEEDLITYFSRNLKKIFYESLYEKCIKNKIKIDLFVSKIKSTICIHLRLDDRTNASDYDGRGSFNYVKELINKKEFIKYDRKISDSKGLDTQVPMSESTLEWFIKKFKKENPEKQVNIITHCDKVPIWLRNIVLKYNVVLHHNDTEENDVLKMIHSDILVLSKSTFAIMAGYYHQGEKVYYPFWGIAASLGLGSIFDKSNWISYV